jgi:hypothetical protein
VYELNEALKAAQSFGLKIWVSSPSMIGTSEIPKVSVSLYREERLL